MTDTNTTGAAEQSGNGPASLDAIAEGLLTSTPAPAPEPKKVQQPTPEDGMDAEKISEDDLRAIVEADRKKTPETEAKQAEEEDDQKPDAEAAEDTGEEIDDALDWLEQLGGEDEKPADNAEAAADGDDEVYRVKVDGEEREVTLADLKRSFSMEGAIDKRLQEATESRNAARTEAEQYVADVRAMHERLAHVYETYNQVMFAPRYERPDPNMLQSDPIGYQQQMAYWQQDQERLNMERGQMEQTLQHAQAVFEQERNARLEAETRALNSRFPGLKNPETRAKFKERIVTVGEALGFTPEEIGSVEDHRLLAMAAEAAAYRELKAKLATGKPAKPAKRRVMPSRGDNRQNTEGTRKATNRRKLMDKARRSGSVDDVAMTLLT